MNKRKIVTLLVAFIGIASAFVLTLLILTTPDYSFQDGSALVSGRLESGYEYVGYIISDTSKVCAATLIDEETIITAGHCLSEKAGKSFFFGTGDFSLEKEKLNAIVLAKFPSGFDISSGKGPDLAIAKLEKGIKLANYPEIAFPFEQCNLSIVAYGSGISTTAPKELFQKKSGSGCSRAITDNFLIIFNENVGICFGDSGGPIFESYGSNKIVGLLSGGLVDQQLSKLRCDPGNTGLAINLSLYKNLIKNFDSKNLQQENFRIFQSDQEFNESLDLDKYKVDEIENSEFVSLIAKPIGSEEMVTRGALVLLVLGIITIVGTYTLLKH